ncbi:MAG: aspartate kinase [Myxococcota bacterium]
MGAGEPIVVQKYGGSSVADVDRIQQVADRIVATRRAGKRVVAVVSAMGKTTDDLVKLAHEITDTPDRRELDMLLTAGERISMALLAMAIRARGMPATSLTGSQCGILTNDAPGGARIVEIRPFRVQDALDQGQIVIVAGFQGVSYRREVTTLGRGGSDTTAVALAAALDAEACEIYSDVDGVYTADPRVVPDARRLDAMSHDEMLAMARCGAKVLGSDAVAYARMHGIALYARGTHGGGETLVRRDEPTDRPHISGVSSRAHCAVLQYDADGQAQVETELANAAVAPLLLVAGAGAAGCGPLTLLLGRDVADAVDPAFERLVQKLRDLLGDRLRGEHQGTLVSIVGPAVGREPALLAQFRSVVTQSVGAPPAWVMAHGLCLSSLLQPAQADAAVVALHRAFVEGGPWRPPAAA